MSGLVSEERQERVLSPAEANERRYGDHFLPVFVDEPLRARAEVLTLWEGRIGPGYRRLVDEAFTDTENLFAGRVDGYRESNTPYHTLGHTVLVLMAMARILDGASRIGSSSGVALSAHDVCAGLLAAIYHDTGYIQDAGDQTGTGAKHTAGHEKRSVRQLERFLSNRPESSSVRRLAGSAIAHTDLRGSGGHLGAVSDENQTLGRQLGTYLMYADLFGQMADRAYLEKLLLLYQEFQEAGFKQYTSEWDVLQGTSEFARTTVLPVDGPAEEMSHLLQVHFEHRLLKRHDLYHSYIRKNLTYLQSIVAEHPTDYRELLRRNSGG
jgi:hypothetical protein